MYALARTWPAPEMPRPGCVWTHTLFIEFPDLASVNAPSRLASLFVRPRGLSWSSYSALAALDLHDREEPEQHIPLKDEEWLAAVLQALYQFPRDRVVAKRAPSVSVEALTLRIWDQQWPRLRRSFRFCTFTTKDRSTTNGSFDLQVLPGTDSANRMRISNTVEAVSVAEDFQPDWLKTLIGDARQPTIGGLRDTLKRLGADILGGREAMPTLCDFHRLISEVGSPSALNEAIRMLESPGLLSTSDLARAQVVDHILSNVEDVEPHAFAFLWDNWRYMEPDQLQRRLPQVAGPLWRVASRRLLTALRSQADEAFNRAEQVLKAVPSDDLLKGWPDGDVPLRDLLAVRKDLIEIPGFWELADFHSPSELHGIELSESAAVALLRGVSREYCMRAAVQLLGSMRVLELLQSGSLGNDKEPKELRWVQYCVKDTSAIAEFLSRVPVPSVKLLLAITEQLLPDSVPNHFGDDPWYTVLLKVRGQLGALPNRLAAYAFARALGRSSRNVAELLQMTFEQLHMAVAGLTLDEAHWQLIELRLPWVPEDKEWNRGGRLRSIAVSVFIDRRLWARTFAFLATNDDVFVALMQEAADRWGGRRFLRSVEESLENDLDSATQARRNLIHSFVRSRGRL